MALLAPKVSWPSPYVSFSCAEAVHSVLSRLTGIITVYIYVYVKSLLVEGGKFSVLCPCHLGPL